MRGGDAASDAERAEAAVAERWIATRAEPSPAASVRGLDGVSRSETTKPQGDVEHDRQSPGRDSFSVGHEDPQSPVREHIGAAAASAFAPSA